MTITVYRYVSSSNDRSPTEEHTITMQMYHTTPVKMRVTPWSQCCSMVWFYGVTTCTKTQLAEAMVQNDCGFAGTYFCSVYKRKPPEKLVYSWQAQKYFTYLEELGWKKIVDVPGPQKYGDHGQDMEIWMYSLIEHGTYRKLHSVLESEISAKSTDRVFGGDVG